MFLRPTAHATPCLRCRQWHLPAAYVARNANFQSTARRRYEHDGATAVAESAREIVSNDSPASDAEPAQVHVHRTRSASFDTHGQIRRINGRMRKQMYQPLEINSLGRRTEILMLKDLPENPEYIAHSTPKRDPTEKISATDIEAILNDEETSKPAEILEAIREHKPFEDILPRASFFAKVNTLANSFAPAQLATFIKTQLTAQTRQQIKNQIAASESPVPIKLGPIAKVKRSPWRPKSTTETQAGMTEPVANPEPPQHQSPRRRTSHKGRASAEKVMRLIWKVQVEEEANAVGRTSIALTPEQWALLQTKDAEDLFSIMRSGKFYRNTRIERSPTETLRIIGPRAEAESIAQLVESAFHRAVSISINLDPLTPAQRLALRVPQNLTDIMSATKTHITTTRQDDALTILAFNQSAMDNALRRVLMLMRPHHPSDVLIVTHTDDQCIEIPIQLRTILPMSSRLHNLVRKVVPRAVTAHNTQADQPSLERSVYRQVHEALQTLPTYTPKAATTLDETPTQAPSHTAYWQSDETITPWEATFGYLLHTPAADTAVPDTLTTATGKIGHGEQPPWNIFASQPPNLAKVLPFFKRTVGSLRDLQQLRIKLISAPRPGPKHVQCSDLPPIELILHFNSVMHPDRPGKRTTLVLADDQAIQLNAIRLVTREDVVDVSCAAHVRDLRFKRRHILHGDVSKAMEDAALGAFVKAIVEGVKASSPLRAPPSVRMQLPSHLSRGSNAHPETAEYLFAGFEHRHVRLFEPEEWKGEMTDMSYAQCAIKMSDIKTDTSGGSRSEMTLTHRSDAISLSGHLVDYALRLLELVDDTHRHGMPASKSKDSPARVATSQGTM